MANAPLYRGVAPSGWQVLARWFMGVSAALIPLLLMGGWAMLASISEMSRDMSSMAKSLEHIARQADDHEQRIRSLEWVVRRRSGDP